ncbi:hypothetical protein BRD15_07560 [Halobacteriales archaeon SW_6_65_15]|nr:MAG: hypothetical protein BRD15_07560 [Halobacteriales archaeon SW_6_65_15]
MNGTRYPRSAMATAPPSPSAAASDRDRRRATLRHARSSITVLTAVQGRHRRSPVYSEFRIALRGYLVPFTPRFAPRLVSQLPVDPFHATGRRVGARPADAPDSPGEVRSSEVTLAALA